MQRFGGLEDEVRRVRDEKFAEEGAVKPYEEIRQAMEEEYSQASRMPKQSIVRLDAVKEEESALIRAKSTLKDVEARQRQLHRAAIARRLQLQMREVRRMKSYLKCGVFRRMQNKGLMHSILISF